MSRPTTIASVAEPSVDGVARASIAAAERIGPYITRTPLVEAHAPSSGSHAKVWYKCENLQRTGSFKLRGAVAKLLSLGAEGREAGVVTASTGNHGLAVGTALTMLGGNGTVFVSRDAAPHKVAKLRTTALELRVIEGSALDAETTARAFAAASGRTYVSPYNDFDVIAGQGTVGVEIAEQLPSVEVVFIAVGGGGLVAGIASALRALSPGVRVVGCWPEHSPAMYDAIRAGKIVPSVDLPTLSDGTAGNIEDGAITVPLCRALIDDMVVVSEQEIATAMRDVILGDHLTVEGAAGVAVAGYRAELRHHPSLAEKQCVLVLCGGNASADTIRLVLGEAS